MDAKTLLLQAIDADKDSQIRMLQAFVRAASPDPPGSTMAAATVLTDYLRSKGIPVVLSGHIDVFPVGDGADWSRGPWFGEIIQDQIHGRGVVDMKSGTASLVIAFAYLYERRDLLCGSIAPCAVSDEETGGQWGTKYLIQQDRARRGGDVMLSTEPAGCRTIRFSEKGTLRMTCTLQTQGAHGAYINVSKGAIRTAIGFINEVIEVVEAMPVNLPDEMAKQITRPEVQKAIEDTMGPGSATIIARPTVNVGTIKGGLKDLVLDTIDLIIPKHAATIKLSVHEAASNPASFLTVSHPMVALLADNAKRLAPGAERPVAIPLMGATHCKHYRYAGVSAYVYGCSSSTMAQMNEPASISEFLYVTKVQASATWDFWQR